MNPYAYLHAVACQPSACPACWWNAGWRPGREEHTLSVRVDTVSDDC